MKLNRFIRVLLIGLVMVFTVGSLSMYANVNDVYAMEDEQTTIPTTVGENVQAKDEPIVPTAIGDTIAQSFPDANLAKAVADAVAGADVNATLTSTMINELTYLNASNRGITNASGIEQLTSLTLLRLEKNQLTSLPTTINQLTLLEHLNLGENSLTSLPESITNMPSLEVLYLNNNELENIPETINNLSKLTLLAIGNNKLTQFPKNVDSILTLEELSIDHNQLTSIPDSISNLINLEYLFLNHNQLTSVPDCFNSFPNLDTLWLNNNQLVLFPPTIAELNNLVELRIQSNEITYLPEDMSGLTSLHYLVLEDNQLTSLPESMGQLTGLWYTYLKGNLLPTNFAATLKNAGMRGSVTDTVQSKLEIKETATKTYTINSGADFINLDLFSILEINRNGALMPVSTEHILALENYVDENNEPVLLTDYLENGIVLKSGKVYAQIRATGVGLFPDTSENALTTDKVELTFEVQTIKYELAFDLNGASGSVPVSQSLEFGELVAQPQNPVREGYLFKGWNTSQDGKGTEWNFSSNTMPANDVILYAQWGISTIKTPDETSSTESPKTGDTTNILGFSTLLLGAGFVLLIIRKMNQRS